ncbi:MAG TPA: hypothetical protein ENJ19_08305 [Gammaproteobacteria bacterium]|nr:hypothetical protein [Gammaproteobacteria bacterium]
MNLHTFTVTVPVGRDILFNYLSDPHNLPEWATVFCKTLRRDGANIKIDTPMGERYFQIRADAGTGVIDMLSSPDGENWNTLPTRVIPLADKHCAYSVCFAQGDLPDELFQAQSASIKQELDNIRQLFS